MAFKKLGRIICAAALSGVAVAVPLFSSGCNTAHPEAAITVQYRIDYKTEDGKDESRIEEYVLKYRLYRNMYPQTVQHFIELADNGYYNDSFVHDINSSKIFIGGYKYLTTDGATYENAEEAYLAAVKDDDDRYDYMDNAVRKAEDEYNTLADPSKGLITPSVYTNFINGKYEGPLTTLIGEFKNNEHKIEKGALDRSFGCLSMYYTNKDATKVKDLLGEKYVYIDKYGSSAGVRGTYEYNSATCIFSIQTDTSTSSSPSYCIFGTLTNPDTLTQLKTATGTKYKNVKVNVDSKTLGENINQSTYNMPEKPIVIKSVKITRY